MGGWRQRWIFGCTLLAITAMAHPASADTGDMNLLANPGFELRTADQPDRWDYFVQPKPGAVARLDNEPHRGEYAIWLHTPTPYDREPVNNWSQNIIAQFGGSTLRVSGFVRVAEAKEAAIWLQCWRKRPWGVIASASTSTDMPVYGTADWQEVSMEVPVPEGTDFVTVRCVLLGTGSAWFDDVAVVRLDSPTAPPNRPKPASDTAPEETVVEPETLPASETRGDMASSPEPDVAARQQEAVLPLVSQLEGEVRRLRDANLLLTDTLQQIQQVNQGLVNEMRAVQAQIETLKKEEDAAGAPALEQVPRLIPPLIPLSESEEFDAP